MTAMRADQEHLSRARTLIEALPYLQRFRGRTVVIKYGGSAMEDPELIEGVLRDVVFLEAVGINPVIVHGGGKAITKRMASAGLQARFVGGMRITDQATIDIVDDVLNNVINRDIVTAINGLGGRAVQVSGRTVFRARKAAPFFHEGQEIDPGFVGEVESCLVDGVLGHIRTETVPVISPVGDDGKGQAYNINADLAAAAIAISLRAFKIIFLSDVEGLLRDEKDPASIIPSIDRAGIDRLKEEGVIRGGMIPKMNSCLDALAAGVEKVHLIDGRIRHSLLLELFTDSGIGTEITQ
jgi:acetylglutamate kinase